MNEETHKITMRRLLESMPGVWFVAHWLSEQKFDVKIFATKYAPTHHQWAEFSDQGDLETSRGRDRVLRCEVKTLSKSFRSDAPPFGKYFIVDGKGTHDRKDPEPDYYLYLSQDRGCIGSLNVPFSKVDWYVEKRTGGETGIESDFYFTPLDKLTWYDHP